MSDFVSISPVPSGTSRRSRSRHGHTVVEILVSSLITLLIVSGVVALLRSVGLSLNRQQVGAAAGNQARTSLDEFAAMIRYADAVLPSREINGVTYVTGDNTVVLSAPGYNPATPGLVLPDVTDYIVFRFDAEKGELREICSPGTGSVRPTRASYRLARNVRSAVFSYRVREVLDHKPLGIYALGAAATAAPTVSVEGGVVSNTWLASLPKELVLTASAGNDIQATYRIDPTTDATATLPLVKEVSATVVFNATDSYGVNRAQSMTRNARLRNHRD